MVVYFIQNGCESNLFDSEKAKSFMLSNENIMCDKSEDADLVVFHACTFTQQKEDEAKGKIKQLLDSDAKHIIVTGCYLNEYINDKRVSFVKDANLLTFIGELQHSTIVIKNNNFKEKDLLLTPFVAISKGCYGNCSFCSIKSVKGSHKSRSIEDILIDIEKRKHHEFVKLVGEEVAGYGRDIGLNLKTLIDEIARRFPRLKIRFGSLNAKILKRFSQKELAIFAYENVTGNIHIPIQSANNDVLKNMNRGYTIEEYLKIYETLTLLGVKNISADIICGFPGEDADAHKQNIEFINNHSFSYMEIFAYQERPGTKAATFKQIDYSIRKQRTIEIIVNYLKSYSKWNNIPYDVLIKTPKVFNTNIL